MARGCRCRAGCRWRRHAHRPLAAAACAMKPPPTEPKAAAAEFDARCGGNQQTPQRPQQQHGQWKPRQQQQQRQRQCSSKSSIRSVIIIISGSSDGSSSSFRTVGRRRMPAAASGLHEQLFQSLAQRMAEGGRGSRVPWRSAVGRSRPTAALRARRCAHSVGARTMRHARHALRLHTDGCASRASAVFAISTTPTAPRSSHRTRPTALVLRAHPSALIALCATAVHV